MNLILLMMLAADPLAEPLPEVVLLDFKASWCGPCNQMVPVMQQLERENFPVRRIDTNQNPEIFRRFGVERMPTFILLVNGEEKKRWVGLQSGDELKAAMSEARRSLAPNEDRDRDRERDRNHERERDPREPSELRDRETNDRAHIATDPPEKRSPGGLAGVFHRIRSQLAGNRSDGPGMEFPTCRAQSPDGSSSIDEISRQPLRATVRVRVPTAKGHEAASGTIVHSEPGKATILTCAHLFLNSTPDAQAEVDLFQGDNVLTFPADVRGGNEDSDVAILQIQTQKRLPSVQIEENETPVRPDDAAFSIGCNQGARPTPLSMKVVDLNRYLGPENIVCTSDPVHGRSGGGLFNADGRLIGVCSCADRKRREGLYMGRGPITRVFEKTGLAHLLKPSPAVPEQQFEEAEAGTGEDDLAAETTRDDDIIKSLFEEVPTVDRNPDFPQEPSEPGASGVSRDDFPFRDPPAPVPGPAAGLTATRASAAAPSAVRDRLLAGMAEAESRTTPVEVTVIVDSNQGSGDKQVIVIPNPSPWLLEILTGQSVSGSAIAESRTDALAPTSVAPNASPLALKPLPWNTDDDPREAPQRNASARNQPSRFMRSVSTQQQLRDDRPAARPARRSTPDGTSLSRR